MKAIEAASVEGDLKDFLKIILNDIDRSLETYLYIIK